MQKSKSIKSESRHSPIQAYPSISVTGSWLWRTNTSGWRRLQRLVPDCIGGITSRGFVSGWHSRGHNWMPQAWRMKADTVSLAPGFRFISLHNWGSVEHQGRVQLCYIKYVLLYTILMYFSLSFRLEWFNLSWLNNTSEPTSYNS